VRIVIDEEEVEVIVLKRRSDPGNSDSTNIDYVHVSANKTARSLSTAKVWGRISIPPISPNYVKKFWTMS
jgi:hypothetical protein